MYLVLHIFMYILQLITLTFLSLLETVSYVTTPLHLHQVTNKQLIYSAICLQNQISLPIRYARSNTTSTDVSTIQQKA